jgi:hypothetical protein
VRAWVWGVDPQRQAFSRGRERSNEARSEMSQEMAPGARGERGRCHRKIFDATLACLFHALLLGNWSGGSGMIRWWCYFSPQYPVGTLLVQVGGQGVWSISGPSLHISQTY